MWALRTTTRTPTFPLSAPRWTRSSRTYTALRRASSDTFRSEPRRPKENAADALLRDPVHERWWWSATGLGVGVKHEAGYQARHQEEPPRALRCEPLARAAAGSPGPRAPAPHRI